MIKVFLHPINAVPYYTSPIVHWPYITLALNYTGPKLHWPYITLALYYTGPILYWPYITLVHIALVYITPVYYNPTFNLTTNQGQNYRYFRPCFHKKYMLLMTSETL